MASGATIIVNAGAPGGGWLAPYPSGTWYHIELTNIDFNSQTFDFVLNGVPVATGISFLDAASEVDELHIYNFHAGTQAHWDEFEVYDVMQVVWLSGPFVPVTLPGLTGTTIPLFDRCNIARTRRVQRDDRRRERRSHQPSGHRYR